MRARPIKLRAGASLFCLGGRFELTLGSSILDKEQGERSGLMFLHWMQNPGRADVETCSYPKGFKARSYVVSPKSANGLGSRVERVCGKHSYTAYVMAAPLTETQLELGWARSKRWFKKHTSASASLTADVRLTTVSSTHTHSVSPKFIPLGVTSMSLEPPIASSANRRVQVGLFL